MFFPDVSSSFQCSLTKHVPVNNFALRPSPVFVKTSIRELLRARASHMVPGFLKSVDHVISLTCRDLDLLDCDALLFILQHSDGVKLNLMWTSIPTERIESLLLKLDRVSHLRSDISFSVLSVTSTFSTDLLIVDGKLIL